MKINLNDPRLLLLHKGNIFPSLINLIIEALEQSVTDMEEDRKVKRKLTNVFIEAFQNVGYHADKLTNQANGEVILVMSLENHYKITTGNYVKTENVENLKKQLNSINQMDSDQIRKAYKQVLSSEGHSEKGTAGLGFMDIARKTGQKLFYRFEEHDDQLSFFTFEARIPKEIESPVSASGFDTLEEGN